MIFEEDDVPGVSSWWPDAMARVAAYKAPSRHDRYLLDGAYKKQQDARVKAWKEKHKAEFNAKRRAAYQKNKASLTYYYKNREAVLAKQRARRLAKASQDPSPSVPEDSLA